MAKQTMRTKKFEIETADLDRFLYPARHKIKQESKLRLETEKYFMYPYYCKHHQHFFWRNVVDNYGNCGLCGFFNNKIHYPLDSKEYKIEVDKMVSVGELEEKKAETIDFSKFPDKFSAVITEENFDEEGNLKITITSKEYGEFPQKFTPMHMGTLQEQLEQLKYKDTEPLKKEPHIWEKTNFQIGFPRWLPVKKE